METGERQTSGGREAKARRKKSKKRRKVEHPSDDHSRQQRGVKDNAGERAAAGGGAGGGGGGGGGKKRPREDAPAVQSTSKHHPFPTEYGDHFETPLQAYRDIEGPLALLSKLLGKKRKHLRIWDPYVSPETERHHTKRMNEKKAGGRRSVRHTDPIPITIPIVPVAAKSTATHDMM